MKRVVLGLLALLGASMAYAANPPLTICTGGPGGAYEALGKDIGKAIADQLKIVAPLDVKVLNTGGSIENAERVSNGSCTMAVMQGDAVVSRGLPRDIQATPAHVEAIYWIHNKTGLKDFDDFSDTKNHDKGIAIVKGSGAQVTLDNFGAQDEKFKDLNVIPFDDWEYAAEAAANGYTRVAGKQVPIAGLLYVGRPGFLPGAITDSYSKDLTIGEVDVSSFKKIKDFNDQDLYFTCQIKNNETGNLKVDTWGKPDTLCMNAQVVFNNEWYGQVDPATVRDVKKAVLRGTNQILRNSR